jgi:hypothetical protein
VRSPPASSVSGPLNPASPEGGKEAQLLAGLRLEQADLSLQLDKVKDKIATGGDFGSAAGAGTSVVQNATEARSLSTLLRLLIWAPLGAVALTNPDCRCAATSSTTRYAATASRRDCRCSW